MLRFELNLSKGTMWSATCLNGPIPKELSDIDLKNISWTHSLDVLKRLAACGAMTWNGKQLIVDLFSSVPLHYLVQRHESDCLQLSAKLQMKETVDLDKCHFIAPCNPPWFIIGSSLKVMHPSVGWRDIADLPRLIAQDELKELQNDNEFPIEIAVAGPLFPAPTPVLVLSDRLGAFANLWMEYGKHREPFPASFHFCLDNRDLACEQHWEKDLLETGYLRKIVDESHYFCPLEKVGKSLAFLLEMGWKIEDCKGRPVLLETKRHLCLEEEGKRLRCRGHFEFGSFTANLSQMVGTFNRRERFLDLGTHSGLIQEEDLLMNLAEDMEIIGTEATIPKSRVGLFQSNSTPWKAPDTLAQLLEGAHQSVSPSQLFKGELRPYQQQGLAWLYALYQSQLHGILADEMGLGKTVQVLAFLSLLDQDKRHLIVVPTSLLFNWEREIERFLPTFTCHRHHGSGRLNWEIPTNGIILTSYHTLRSDQDLFNHLDWECVIIDEAQMVKNPDSQVARALYMLKSRFRLGMTGTLIENHAKELWAHFHFLMPGMLGEREHFENHLNLTQVDSRYAHKIRKMITPFILRRKKEMVAKDLPPLTEQVAYVEMTAEQRRLYEEFLAGAKQGLLKKVELEGQKKHRLAIFEVLLRLRQIACHPLLVSHLASENSGSGKMEALFMDIEAIREEGKKALIFSQFASMLHLIARELAAQGIPFCLLEGATINREEEVRRFQEDPSVPIFLMTLKAGGVGLNLTAADYVLLYDPWWHEAAEAQAISRAHRMGQKKPVIAKRYIVAESIEEKLLTLKKAKEALFSSLIEGDLSGPELSLDDLEFLLK